MNTPRLPSLLLAGALTLGMVIAPSQVLATPPKTTKIDINAHLQRANKLLEYNGISRAATLYEEVLRAEPHTYPDVAFVLGQIYEHKEEPAKATLFYATYLSLSHGGAQSLDAKEAIKRLRQPDWQRLHISPPDGVTGKIIINDLYIVSDASTPVELFLPQAPYTISINLQDHHKESYDIDLEEGGVSLNPRPEAFVFFGYLNLNVRGIEDAHITVTQEKADTIKGAVHTQHFVGEPGKTLELPSGVYFIEITDPDHERWVRRVHIERDIDSDVHARLTRALPPEIRFDDLRHEEMKGIIQRNALRMVGKATIKASNTSSQVATGTLSREEALDLGPKSRVVAIY